VKPKRPRITDVARRAGVSESAVSVVLNNRVGEQVRVSEETQRKIWAAVRELGYVANPVAQTLAGGRTGIIAVFTFEPFFPIDARNFYYPFLIGIEAEAEQRGYDLLLVTGGKGVQDGKRSIYRAGINQLARADGAILLGHGDRAEVERLLADGFPFVYVGKRDLPGVSYIAADYLAATVELAEALIALGHQQIAYLRSTRQTEASQDRELGMRRALEGGGLAFTMHSVEPVQVTEALLAGLLAAGFTAIVAEDDELGRETLRAGARLGLACPRDFSLAVLGNPLNPLADVPNWTTFNIPRRQMGVEAFRLLLELLALPAEADGAAVPLRRTLMCSFQPGETTRQR
jgi:DNA-binding LacI/PurR family transcriptional regulator